MQVVLAGNSGVGKSTLLQPLAAVLGATAVSEPAPENEFLMNSYVDPSRWAYAAQVEFMRRRADLICQGQRKGEHLLADRSLSEDFRVFVSAWYVGGSLTRAEYRSLSGLYEFLEKVTPPVDAVIYLYCNPAVAMRRIADRNRQVGSPITPSTLFQRRSAAYTRWLDELTLPVIRLDTTAITLDDIASVSVTLAAQVRATIGWERSR